MLPLSEACHIPENHLVNLKSHEKAAFALKMEAVASSVTFVIADYSASHHRQFILILITSYPRVSRISCNRDDGSSRIIRNVGTASYSRRRLLLLKARLHVSPGLINAVESTKVNRVNSSFQRKWSTGLTGEQVGDGQLSFNVVDSLWVTHRRLPCKQASHDPFPSVERVVLVRN
jgi:hypothetical protein